jgi:hypothetical protein
MPKDKPNKGTERNLQWKLNTFEERNQRRLKALPYSCISSVNIVKMAILPKVTCIFGAISIKTPMTFIREIENSMLRFIWKHERPWLVKIKMSKKTNARDITIPDFKFYYRAIAMKTSYYWQKSRPKIQWNRIEDPNLNPSSMPTWFLTKLPKT